MGEEEIPTDPSSPSLPGPTALPGRGARAVAFVAIIVAGLCGLLIGNALVSLQCSGNCGVQIGLGMLVGAVGAAAGVAVIAVLVLRATGEWATGPGSGAGARRS